jgi:hypothetical protein
MLVHRALHLSSGIARHLVRGARQLQLSASWELLLPRNCLVARFQWVLFRDQWRSPSWWRIVPRIRRITLRCDTSGNQDLPPTLVVQLMVEKSVLTAPPAADVALRAMFSFRGPPACADATRYSRIGAPACAARRSGHLRENGRAIVRSGDYVSNHETRESTRPERHPERRPSARVRFRSASSHQITELMIVAAKEPGSALLSGQSLTDPGAPNGEIVSRLQIVGSKTRKRLHLGQIILPRAITFA